MLDIQLLFLSLLYTATTFSMMEPCQPPLQIPKVRFEVVIASWKLESLPNPKFNLLYQILQNPCLELQYQGGGLSSATFYRLYGTCNFRRMFRFTARLSRHYSCWRTVLTLWNQTVPKGYEHRRSSTELYEFGLDLRMGLSLASEKLGNSSHNVMFIPSDTPASRKLTEDEIRKNFKVFEHDANGTYAEIPKCWCSNRSQSEMWSRRRRGAWNMEFRFLIKFAFVVTGVVALGYGAYRAWLARGGAFPVNIVREVDANRLRYCDAQSNKTTARIKKSKKIIDHQL